MKRNQMCCLLLGWLLSWYSPLKAQTGPSFSLQQLIDTALKNNRLLSVKNWQVQEKKSKLKEDEIKKYPSAQLDGSYQYNFNLPDFTIPAGSIGSTGTNGNELLPSENIKLKLGDKSMYNVGVSLYQPLTQQAKISTGLEIDKTDIRISEKDKAKAEMQLSLAVQKLYYGVLITRKQLEEAGAKLELAKARLLDEETALEAGKTITAGLSGLKAAVAEEEQRIMKLDILLQDYKSELASVTNISENDIELAPVDPLLTPVEPMNVYKEQVSANPDIQITQLTREKALLGIKAARQSNIPDIGLVAGYYYQQGNPIMATSNPYVGINLKWNLQDLFSNGAILQQRKAQLKQAEENLAYQQQQYNTEIGKAHRKISQTAVLVEVAKKAVEYRRDELKLQEDRLASGLDVKTAVLEVRSNLAKAEADLYSAQLSYLVSVAELKSLASNR